MSGWWDPEARLNEVARGLSLVAQEREPSRLISRANAVACTIAGARAAVTVLLDHGAAGGLRASASSGLEFTADGPALALQSLRDPVTTTFEIAPLRESFGLTAGAPFSHAFRIPLLEGGRLLGFLAVIDADGGDLGEVERSLLGALTAALATTYVHIEAMDSRGGAGPGEDTQSRAHGEALSREADKMEAIGRLAGGVAHDFNNQLSIILSYSSMVKEALHPADHLREDVEHIERAGHRARDLTRQLLAVGRRQMLRPQLVDLSAMLERIAESARRRGGPHVEVDVSEPFPGFARIDPVELEHAIVGIVGNALDAMPGGGRLTLALQRALVDESFCRVHAGMNPGPHLSITVTDTGTGMDEATLARAFEPFFSTKEAGRGLGLSTAFGVVHQSGGTLWGESLLGRGTTFRLYLPQALADGLPATRASRAPASSDSPTVLVVEDDPQVRRLTGSILKRVGYRILEATDGARALHLSDTHDGPIDLLVTDVIMPQMGGRELAERLAVLRPDTKVLFVSGYTDGSLFQDDLRDSSFAFLPKPFTADALIRMVRGVLEAAE